MRVLITTDWYAPAVNGVVSSVMILKKHLTEKGHEVHILTLGHKLRPYTEGDVTYIPSVSLGRVYPEVRATNHLGQLVSYRQIRAILRWHPDVVHSQCEFFTYPVARFIARRLNVPLVHTYHTVYEYYTHYICPSRRLAHTIAKGISRHTLKHADMVVAPTHKVESLLEGYRVKTPVSVVPTGIELGRFTADPGADWLRDTKARLGIGPDQFVLLYVGRLAQEKNLEEILSFLPDLPERGSFRMLIVGDGPDGERLRGIVREKGLEDTVIFTGQVDPREVGSYYHLGDVFVNASVSETQGLTYFEAMSAGLPVICRRDPCLDGIVENGENGWQYNTEAEFAEYLAACRHDPALRARISAAAREAGARCSAEAFADSIEHLYLEMEHRKEESRTKKGRFL